MDDMRRIGPWTVPALGAGTWAIGGEWDFDGRPAGWGTVDDAESTAALRAAYDGGVRLFDTADVYGAGHAERVLGAALADVRDDVVITTKVGLVFDEDTRTGSGSDLSAAHIRRACEDSLRRLGTDRIDVYQIHPGDAGLAEVAVAAFEELREAGKIRHYGTSATDPDHIAAVVAGGHAVSVQQELNVFGADEPALAACERLDLAVLARSPLAMGLLSGRYRDPAQLDAGDVRRNTPYWTWFDDDAMAGWLDRIDAVHDILTSGGRTLVQGALAYVWGRSERAIALPGIRTPAQARELAGALEFGALTPAQVVEVERLAGARSTA